MAKKRYYQGAKDRMDERRAMENKDFNMMSMDRSSHANLPKEVVYKDWSDYSTLSDKGINDTKYGIDEQISADVSKANSHRSDSKY